jgi:hypothetical protein
MNTYEFHRMANVIKYLSNTEALAGKDGDGEVWPKHIQQYDRPHVEEARRQCELIELTGSVRRCDLFLRALKPGLRWLELRNQAKFLLEEIEGELCQRRFAFVSTAKATMQDSISVDWADIWAKFPSSKDDTERATDCYALEQHTASVFHLMRVAEFGLRALAKKLHVKITHKGKACPIEYGDWEKVITEIKNKIALARTLPAGLKKQTKLEFYSDGADHCMFMKDIWRNNVAHTRKVYNDSEALAVLTRVKGFMAFLAHI